MINDESSYTEDELRLFSTSAVIPKPVIMVEVDANETVVELSTKVEFCSFKLGEINSDGSAKILSENLIVVQKVDNESPDTDGKYVFIREEVVDNRTKIHISRIYLNSSRLVLFVLQWPIDVIQQEMITSNEKRIAKLESENRELKNIIDKITSRLGDIENKFSSYATVEGMKAVDNKFSSYTTTDGVNASIKAVSDKFASYSTTEVMNNSIKAVSDKFASYSTTEVIENKYSKKIEVIVGNREEVLRRYELKSICISKLVKLEKQNHIVVEFNTDKPLTNLQVPWLIGVQWVWGGDAPEWK